MTIDSPRGGTSTSAAEAAAALEAAQARAAAEARAAAAAKAAAAARAAAAQKAKAAQDAETLRENNRATALAPKPAPTSTVVTPITKPPPARTIEVARGVSYDTGTQKVTVKPPVTYQPVAAKTAAKPATVSPSTTNSADAGHRRDEISDARKNDPMVTAMETTRATATTFRTAADNYNDNPSASNKAALDQAITAYGNAIRQQGTIAAWRASGDGSNVNTEVAKQIAFATSLEDTQGRTFNTKQQQVITKALTPFIQESVAGNSSTVLGLQIEQTQARQTGGYDPTQLRGQLPGQISTQQQTAATAAADAGRVNDLAGYGSGYVTQSAATEAADSAAAAAKANKAADTTLGKLATDQDYDSKIATTRLKENNDQLQTATGRVTALTGYGSGYVTQAANKDAANAKTANDNAVLDVTQANNAQDLTQALRGSLKTDGKPQAAQQTFDAANANRIAYNPNAVDGRSQVYTNGYDPTLIAPPTDFTPKVMSGDSAAAGAAGTKIIGPGQYQLADGTQVTRGADGQWRVKTANGYYTAETQNDFGYVAPDAAKNGQRMNAAAAGLWEAQYQSALTDRKLADAQSANSRILVGPNGQLIGLGTDLAPLRAQDQAAAKKLCYPSNAPQAQQAGLTQKIEAWQGAERNYQALKAGVSPDGTTPTAAQVTDAKQQADSAWAQVVAGQAGLNDANATQRLAASQTKLDAANAALQAKVPYSLAGQVPDAGVKLFLAQPAQQQAITQQQAAATQYAEATALKQTTATQLEGATTQAFITKYLNSNQLYDDSTAQGTIIADAQNKEARDQQNAEIMATKKGDRLGSILESVGGVAEMVGGGVLFVASLPADALGGAGIVGQVAGGYAFVDAMNRAFHGGSDAAKNETTPGYWTQFLDKVPGVDATTAGRIDTGLGVAGMVVGGGSGAVKAIAEGSRLARVAGAGNLVFMVDTMAPGASYALTGKTWTPGSTQALTAMTGMSEDDASKALMVTALIGGVAGHAVGSKISARSTPERVLPQGLFSDRAPVSRDYSNTIAGRKAGTAAPVLGSSDTAPPSGVLGTNGAPGNGTVVQPVRSAGTPGRRAGVEPDGSAPTGARGNAGSLAGEAPASAPRAPAPVEQAPSAVPPRTAASNSDRPLPQSTGGRQQGATSSSGAQGRAPDLTVTEAKQLWQNTRGIEMDSSGVWSVPTLSRGANALIRRSPTMQAILGEMAQKGWRVTTRNGSGTYAWDMSGTGTDGLVVVDRGLLSNPVETVGALAHESGHTITPGSTLKSVPAAIGDEGLAETVRLNVLDELGLATTTRDRTALAQLNLLRRLPEEQSNLALGGLQTTRADIVTSNSGQRYLDYYAQSIHGNQTSFDWFNNRASSPNPPSGRRGAGRNHQTVSPLPQHTEAEIGDAFVTTDPVVVTGARSIDRGQSYEAGVRDLYGDIPFQERLYTAIVNGERVNGVADTVTSVAGRYTAVEVKFVDDWATSLRNPNSANGDRAWAVTEQQSMVDQATKYSVAFDGGVIYHTNSPELAAHYTLVFNSAGVTNFRFLITPAT